MVQNIPRDLLLEHGKGIAERLQASKAELAQQFLNAALQTNKWVAYFEPHKNQQESFIETEFFAFVDYLVLYFSTADEGYLNLYVGEKLKESFDPAQDFDGNRENKKKILHGDRHAFEGIAALLPSKESMQLFFKVIDYIQEVVSGEVEHTLNILFVGDCLYLDVMAFLAAPLFVNKIGLFPTFATSKNPFELHAFIKEKSGMKFDLIFFSPFTYLFNLEINQIYNWRKSWIGEKEIQGLEEGWKQSKATLNLLEDLFDCPIYVHNLSAVYLEDSAFKRLVKRLLTYRLRKRAEAFLNPKIAAHIEERNTKSFKHLFLFDETTLTKKYGGMFLGEFLYHSALQHPARFGEAIAKEYAKIILVHAYLMKKKVIVCDLDNTLWKGLIGEGNVDQFLDRQQSLLDLKTNGIVLAVASRNDPANVAWDDALLQEKDFVQLAINWDRKTVQMQAIQKGLNIKFKDFVFIDDQAEEREMVSLGCKGIDCFDPNEEMTWKLFNIWEKTLKDPSNTDRTQLYREREARKKSLQLDQEEDIVAQSDAARLLESLNLVLTIRKAEERDSKRIVELVNRTNQFNVKGSRTSFNEVKQWLNSSDHSILLGEVKDRFGEMGDICVLITEENEAQIDILIFVLSCRVFGYGIEKAMLNALKKVAKEKRKSLRGTYIPTDRNQPCAEVFLRNEFTYAELHWWWKPKTPLMPEDAWLRIIS